MECLEQTIFLSSKSWVPVRGTNTTVLFTTLQSGGVVFLKYCTGTVCTTVVSSVEEIENLKIIIKGSSGYSTAVDVPGTGTFERVPGTRYCIYYLSLEYSLFQNILNIWGLKLNHKLINIFHPSCCNKKDYKSATIIIINK